MAVSKPSVSQEDTLVEPDSQPTGGPSWGAYSGLFLAVLLLFSLVAINLYQVCQLKQQEYEEKRADLKRLRQTVYSAEYTNQQLRARVAHLKTDSGVEEIARDKLGLLAPGEISFVVVPPPAPGRQEGEATAPPLPPEPGPTLYQRLLHAIFIRK